MNRIKQLTREILSTSTCGREAAEIFDGRWKDFEESGDVGGGVGAAEGKADGSAGTVFIVRLGGCPCFVRASVKGADDGRRFERAG